MNNELSLLGLAMRAGKVLSGDELVLKAIRSGDASLVVLAGDASANTQKKFRDKCSSYQIPLLIGYDRDQLGTSIGKDGRVVLALTDNGFAKLLRKRIGDSSEVEYIEHTGAEG
ncbi:YlxQ family RNA-binding protein [Paenibacillus wulumuqiensis]|uniref:YlxQ family RNA-binding protein n=1 Tax=Paenibacillus wulumuqiensis TaxID=1567107 RepID=UPI000619BAE2|nr:YlxQ family RNA-binding protein [Paenibacillus wulumuqiensis]